jgi:hypothetical protein
VVFGGDKQQQANAAQIAEWERLVSQLSLPTIGEFECDTYPYGY